MLVVAIILLILVLIALLRVGATAEYGEQGLLVTANIGPLRIKVLPQKDKKEKPKDEKKEAKKQAKREKKKAEKKAKKETNKESGQKGGMLKKLQEMLPAIRETLGRFKRKFTINDLRIYFMSAGEDAFKTAMNFGRVSAGLGVIHALLYDNFKIKKCDFRTAANFDTTESYIYIRARFSLAIWEIVYIAWAMVKYLLKSNLKTKGKADIKDGETASDRPTHGINYAENTGDGGR